MKCTLLLLVFFTFQINAYSQNTKIDSLKSLIYNTANTQEKITLLNKITQEYLNTNTNTDSAFTYSKKSIASLSEIAPAKTKDFIHLSTDTYILLAKVKREKGNLEDANKILNSLLTKGEDISAKEMAVINYEKGFIFKFQGNNDSSLSYFKKAYLVNQVLSDTIAMYKSLAEMSNLYLDFGQNARALENLQEVLLLSEAIQNKRLMCDANNYIARVYTFNEDYELAKKYFTISYELTLDIKDSVSQEKTLNNIGYVLNKLGETDKALTYFFKGINLVSSRKDPCTTIYPFYNIGNIHRVHGKYDSSFYYLDVADKGAIQCNDKYLEALVKIDLGLLYYDRNKLRKAEGILIKALQIANKSMLAGEKREALKALSATKEKLGDTRGALELYKKYEVIKDSLYNKDNTRKLAKMEANYEFTKQKKETELENKVRELEQQQELYTAIWMRNTFIFGFLIMIIFVFLIYRNFLRKRNANQVLNKLNQEVLEQKEELMLQAEELKTANEEIACINENLEDRIKSRTRVIAMQNKKILDYVQYNSHQVRGPLARILGLVSLFERNAVNPDEFNSLLEQIQLSAEDLDEMVKSMTQKLEKEKKNII